MINRSLEQEIIRSIDATAAATVPMIIKDLIKEHVSERNRLEQSWEEYKGNVPILSKPALQNKYAPDNRPANDYRGLIVSEKVNFLTGQPIKVAYPPDENAESLIQSFLKVNNYETLDNNTMTYLAATGKAFRLLYLSNNIVSDKVEVRISNQLPWECIVITDATLDNLPVYGLIYYQIDVIEGNESKKRYRAEFYDKENVYYFIENDKKNFIPDYSSGDAVEQHGFDIMPLIEFNNNLLKVSDFEKVTSLIDSYDNALSYALNDNEAVGNALMIFKDVKLTQELIDKSKYLRGIQIDSTPSKPNPSVDYLTKDIKIDNTETLCKMLEENIFKFSSTVDIYNEAFSGGSVSGESRKQQLIPLEMKCVETERLFQYGLRRMFNVVATYWRKIFGTEVMPEEIDFIFTRSIIPTELTTDKLLSLYTAKLISQETALSKLDFIDDPKDEIDKLSGTVEIQPEIETQEE